VAALAKQYGVGANRLSANGVAYLAPVAVNTSEEGRAKNRRVELVPKQGAPWAPAATLRFDLCSQFFHPGHCSRKALPKVPGT
jgi:hypothetical protein